VEPAYAIPTVKFDPKRVTEAVKTDLKYNIKEIKEFDQSHFDQIYDLGARRNKEVNASAIRGDIGSDRDSLLASFWLSQNYNSLQERSAATKAADMGYRQHNPQE
jgi:hypothetical protein